MRVKTPANLGVNHGITLAGHGGARRQAARWSIHLVIRAILLMTVLISSFGKNVGAETSLDDGTCLDCHMDKDLVAVTRRGATLKLQVDPTSITSSIHENLSCTDCHGGAITWEEAPHNGGKPLALLCVTCHKPEIEKYDMSIHGISSLRGDQHAATCSSCHGSHTILPSTDRDSPTHKFNLHTTCGFCHQQREIVDSHNISEKQPVSHYQDSIHGKALLQDGLIVAPTCNDCHGSHLILPRLHPDSRIFNDTVSKTCGHCHVLTEERYNRSIHGQLVLNHDHRGPVCSDCHSAHSIDDPRSSRFHLKSDLMCGSCHEDRLKNYHETLHGKALVLGRDEVAACADCHGSHDILPQSNPDSKINQRNRLATCRKCHSRATRNFADFIVHADHTDPVNYPQLYYVFWSMTLLLISTFAFFAIHTILWLFRSLVLFVRDSKQFRIKKESIRDDEEQFIRFRPVERFIHGLIISSFLLLVLTGMPLKFADTEWGQFLFSLIGGQKVASVLHRFGALITLFYFTLHILTVLISLLKNRQSWRNPATGKLSFRSLMATFFGPDSPMPRFQDLRDMVAHNRWFFGRGEKPQFDRWTYWEKFDYLAVFWGVAIIGGSGLVLWFPVFFTTFLPGWIINVAFIIHSDEALLAAGFIFTFHFFNVHFRPEKFPMDPVIFSGRISKSEMLHERKRLYDRWVANNELDEHKVRDDWESRRRYILPLGYLAFFIGLVLMVLIYFAMLSRIL